MSMTNEKAIDLLRRMQEPEAYEPQITEEAFEALEMAIMALGTDTDVGTMEVACENCMHCTGAAGNEHCFNCAHYYEDNFIPRRE